MLDRLKKELKKLNLGKQPRYMIPMVALPFSLLLNGIGTNIFTTDDKNAPAVTSSMNTELQDADLEKAQTKNKFDALLAAYDKKEDFSAIQDLGDSGAKQMELDDKNLYSMNEMDKITQANGRGLSNYGATSAPTNYSLFKNSASNTNATPLSNSLGIQPKFNAMSGSVDNTEIGRRPSNRYENYLANRDNVNSSNGNYNNYPPQNYERETPRQAAPFDDNMALFRAQMSVIDSMTNKRRNKTAEKPKFETEETVDNKTDLTKPKLQKDPLSKADAKTESKPQIIEVTKTVNDNSRYFNTVGLSKNNSFIKAILDEGLKVYDGSRVRIRLMDDITLDGKELPEGTYLYGVISGFATQRVLLNITNIALGSEILNVKLDVYDQDGMKGLYIPESLFREIAKEASAKTVGGQNISFSDNNAINATQMAYSAAQDIYKTSTRALSDAIRKRKAVLKYNTQIFLVNTK